MAGRAIAQLALSENYQVGGTVHNSFPSELKTFTDQGLLKCYSVDLRDSGETKMTIAAFQPDVVIHLAGKALGRLDKRILDPQVYEENITIFKNVLSAVKTLTNSPRFILSSGCLVYSKSISDFISEIPVANLPSIDLNKEPYRASRLDQEKLLVEEKGIDYIITRPTQFTGAGKIPGVVEYYIASEILGILQGKKKNILVRNKLGEVDLLDVRDVAKAYLILIAKGQRGEVYHISSGSPVIVEHLAKVFLEAVGLNPKQFPVVSTDKEETIYFRFSPAKLKKLGWKPQFSLKDALSNYWEYFKKQERSKSDIL